MDQGGTPLNHLQLEPETYQNVLNVCSNPSDSVTVVRLNSGSATGALEGAVDVAYICKQCRLAYVNEMTVSNHQKTCKAQGVVRLTRTRYNCKNCDHESFDSVHDFQRHFDSQHLPEPALSPSAGLSHEMEDVVNQITALAAKAAAQSPNSDSNANIFFPPPEPKNSKLFITPNSVPVPSTGQ